MGVTVRSLREGDQTHSKEVWDNGENGEEVGRYEAEKKAGLQEVSRRPPTSPRATPLWVRCKLVQEVQMRQGIGKRKSAARLRREVKLPVSLPTVLNILREEGLYKGKRKVGEKKRDVREEKKLLPAFEKGGREVPG